MTAGARQSPAPAILFLQIQMKLTLIALTLVLALLLVGCSAGQTSQDQLEKDTKSIQLQPDAKPIDSGAQIAPSKKGGS
jgi:hypothetical protein